MEKFILGFLCGISLAIAIAMVALASTPFAGLAVLDILQ
jgi:hypothetical protein